MEYMSDTLFISGKKKRTATAKDIFDKVSKGIKKKGPTKDWTCTFDEENETIYIDFNDEQSETFILKFGEKHVFSAICKLYWPIDETTNSCEGENLKALLDLLYRAKSKYNSISVTDDYGLAEGYWESKKYRFEFRELTDEEYKRVERLFNAGFTKHEDLLRAIMAEDMEMDYSEIKGYENPEVSLGWENVGSINNTLTSYIYETSSFGDEGEVFSLHSNFFGDPNKYFMALVAFEEGVGWVFCDGTRVDYDAKMHPESARKITTDKHRCMSPNDAQVDLMFRDMFAPQFISETDPLKRCVLAYRYFVSAYDFCGFKFTGHRKRQFISDKILEEYGEHGLQYLTFRVTRNWLDHKIGYDYELFCKNAKSRYGSDFVSSFNEIHEKYGRISRFCNELEYYAVGTGKYRDKTLMNRS